MTHSHQWQHLDIDTTWSTCTSIQICNFDSNKPFNKILNDDIYEKIQTFLPLTCLLTYIYAYIMQQHDTSLCGLYVICVCTWNCIWNQTKSILSH
jgi:hypothetical protein